MLVFLKVRRAFSQFEGESTSLSSSHLLTSLTPFHTQKKKKLVFPALFEVHCSLVCVLQSNSFCLRLFLVLSKKHGNVESLASMFSFFQRSNCVYLDLRLGAVNPKFRFVLALFYHSRITISSVVGVLSSFLYFLLFIP